MNIARHSSVYARMTRAERHHLTQIIEGRLAGLRDAVCERLRDLGLARRDGISFVATEEGRYVASRTGSSR